MTVDDVSALLHQEYAVSRMSDDGLREALVRADVDHDTTMLLAIGEESALRRVDLVQMVATLPNTSPPTRFTAKWLMDQGQDKLPLTSSEIVAAGECTGNCMTATSLHDECDCACGGAWHGVLANVAVTERRAIRR